LCPRPPRCLSQRTTLFIRSQSWSRWSI